MKFLFKLLILATKGNSLFSLKYLREFRYFLYRKYLNSPRLYVADRVTIVKAHSNKEGFFKALGEVNIGDDVYIDFSGTVIFGESIAVSEGAKIFTHNHSIHDGNVNWKLNPIKFSKLEVGNYVWIGANAVILPSVEYIGEGAVIAAGAVLTKNAEKFGVYAGNPARKISDRRIKDES